MSPETTSHSKEDLLKLLTSSREAITYWSSSLLLSSKVPVTTTQAEKNQIKSSKLENPLEELIKLSKLIHAHITKIGIVFKPPISSDNYNACYKELELTSKTIVFIVSLSNQLINDSDLYSKLFVKHLLDDINILFTNYSYLTAELELLLSDEENPTSDSDKLPANSEEETSSDARLISVGKIWESCETIQKASKLGSSGLIKLKLKESNKLIRDAFEELEEWVENPSLLNDDNPFDLGDDEDYSFSDNESAIGSKINAPGLESDEDKDDKVDEELIQFAKIWVQRINLIKLLVSSLDKSIPISKYNIKFSNGIDLLEVKRNKLGELVDDVVAAIVYDQDLGEAKETSEQLSKETNKVVEVVKNLNNADEKKCRWLDTWKVKFNT